MKLIIKLLTMNLLFAVACNQSMAQDNSIGDDVLNASLNGHVLAGGNSFMGVIVQPNSAAGDVDLIIIAEAQDDTFDSVLNVSIDSTTNVIADNDDFNAQVNDFGDGDIATARACLLNSLGLNSRLRQADAVVLVSVPANSTNAARPVFAEVTEFQGRAGNVNLQVLQVDGFLLGGQCPDF